MLKFAGSFCLALFALSGSAALAGNAAPKLEGHWEGVIFVRPAEFEVDMDLELSRSAEGAVTGTLAYPNQGTNPYRLDSFLVDGTKVAFAATDENGTVSSFQGRLEEGGRTIRGELTESGQQAPFELYWRGEKAGEPRTATLQNLSADGAELKALFNQDEGKVRLLMVHSPTCGVCRMGAGVVQRNVLEQVQDPRFSVYIVWEAISKQDTREAAEQAAGRIADARIKNFWSEGRFTSQTFKSAVGVQKTTAWDVFLVFSAGKRWTETAPALDFFMHNLRSHEEMPKDRLLNGGKLATAIQGLLAAPAANGR
jgi:hypothetical protein